jgi:hypothetical protein
MNIVKNGALILNVPKTKIVVFRKRSQLKNDEHLFYANKELKVVNDFNYLGISLDVGWEFYL